MAKKFTPKVITANDLLEGDVIYLKADSSWTRVHAEAELFIDEADAQIRLIEASKDPHVVGAYLADARPSDNGPEPVHFREAFRSVGPSNYFHGKQEGAV